MEKQKNEALYDVLYNTDGSYNVTLQTFDKEYSSDINIIRENVPNNHWWKYQVLVMAKSKDQAIKIAQDLWTEYKAKKEGVV